MTQTTQELDSIYANTADKPAMLRLLAAYGRTRDIVKWAQAKQTGTGRIVKVS